jgi:oligopeptidase B
MLKPPVARRIPHVENVNGDRRQDDYRWLRDKDDPAVRAYLEAENAYTDAVLKRTEAFQERLYGEMLARIKEDDQSVPYRKDEHLYYSRTETGKQYPILCRKTGTLAAPEEVTLDLNQLAEGHPFLSLGVYAASDDGRRLAYSTDVTGFREYTLYVKDLATGELLPDRVEKVASAAWSADPSVLFYVTEDHAKRAYRLWRHRLGAVSDDLLYEETDELFRVHVARSRSERMVFVSSRSFTTTEVRWLPADRPHDAWTLVLPREHEHEYDVDHGGDVFFIRTNAGGRRNFRLVTAPVDDPRPERWTEILAHRDEVMLEDIDVFAGHYVVTEREDGLLKLHVTDRGTGEAHHVEFPEPAYDLSPEPNLVFDTAVFRFRYQSFVTPSSVFDYDMVARRLTLLKQTEVLGGYDRTRYRSERVHATAEDGARIPISLVCLADTPRDGTSPLLLAGYGAYGIAYPVTFSSARLSLLDRGVAIAIAHVRGGGELGKRWHDAGRMLAKRNTFTDFISAAAFLVARGSTRRDRLVIEGGSAGGLLVGAVLNERPDLCAAAVLRVPFVDVINTMLDESLPLTVGEFEEWGNPKIKEQYEYMKGYCPYTNVTAKPYPAILVRTSLNDSQVMYWEPAKYVAKLRATVPGEGPGVLAGDGLAQGDHPLLFKINLDAGHGGASGRYDALRELAFDYAFMLTLLGRADVSPAAPSERS